MTENEISARMRGDIEKGMPDMLPRIMESCASEHQMSSLPVQKRHTSRMLRSIGALVACLIIFCGGMLLGIFLPSSPTGDPLPAETVIYMDVNPSIELSLDANGRVVGCTAGNSDAEEILSQLELVGAERDKALTQILGTLYLNGYINEENNAVLISIDGTEGSDSSDLLGEVTERINAIFERAPISCSIIAQSINKSDSLSELASEYGISVGRMQLIEKLIAGMDSLDETDLPRLASLTVGELNLMYTSAKTAGEAFAGDIVSGLIAGFLKTEDAITELLRAIGQSHSIISEYESLADCIEYDGGMRMVYRISMRFKYSNNLYTFTIDSRTGELLETDFEPGVFSD